MSNIADDKDDVYPKDPQLEIWERVVGLEEAKNYHPNLLFKWEPLKKGAVEKTTPYKGKYMSACLSL